jgi:hypothetical protein
MRFQFYDVFYLLNSHQNVSAAIAVIFRVMLLLQEHNGTTNHICAFVFL